MVQGTGHRLVATEPDGPDRTIFRIERGPSDPDVQGSTRLGRVADVPSRRVRHRDWLIGKAAGSRSARIPTGFAPRGAVVEEGAPAFPYTETERDRVWAHNVASLYEQATASQWDASADIRWRDLEPSRPPRARGLSIMTHLAENEYAALYVPARFIRGSIRTSRRSPCSSRRR